LCFRRDDCPPDNFRDLRDERVADAVDRRMRTLDNPGFCIACGSEQDGCEPDARHYECEHCGEHEVYGADELLFKVVL
jgi:hypothetical protein